MDSPRERIQMKLSAITALNISLSILLAALLVTGGCNKVTQTGITESRAVCIEMMQKIPASEEDFEFWDVKALRSDPDLKEMYRVWYERRAQYLEQRYGINSSGIDYVAGSGLLNVFKIYYDTAAFRDKIKTDFYRDTTYEDMEVWKSAPSHDPQSVTGGWVLANGLLVRGSNNSNVDDYIDVIKGKVSSKYEIKANTEMLEKLPAGIVTRIGQSSYPGGTIITGMALKKEDNGALRWTNIFRYEGDESTQNTQIEKHFNEIKDDFNKSQELLAQRGGYAPFSEFSIEREGSYIRWSMLVEERYIIAVLFFG